MYHTLINLDSKLTSEQVQYRAYVFQQLRTVEQLAHLLKLSKKDLQLLAAHPAYDTFHLPKPNGGLRLIQSPHKPLKMVQDRLGRWFQYLYYTYMPPAAYGFVIVPAGEIYPRNILTNARRHQGQAYVLNADLKDFFHFVKQERLETMLQTHPFQCSKHAARCLAKLCTLDGRLPMGAPSSPVLSNLACMELDRKLIELARKQGWIYTRYADDLTFSGSTPFDIDALMGISQVIVSEGFQINDQKIRLQTQADPPEVTGLLLLQEGIDVSPDFIAGIEEDLDLLRMLLTPRMVQRNIFNTYPVRQLRQSIQGQIQFLAFIRGRWHPSVLAYTQLLELSAQKVI